MSELDDKLNSILSNPQMMQQIMSLAQSLNSQESKEQAPQPAQNQPSGNNFSPGINPGMIARFSSIMQRGSIDQEQQSLLKSLTPYLSRQKLQKLEKAMYAAKMAGIASEMINANSRKSITGR